MYTEDDHRRALDNIIDDIAYLDKMRAIDARCQAIDPSTERFDRMPPEGFTRQDWYDAAIRTLCALHDILPDDVLIALNTRDRAERKFHSMRALHQLKCNGDREQDASWNLKQLLEAM